MLSCRHKSPLHLRCGRIPNRFPLANRQNCRLQTCPFPDLDWRWEFLVPCFLVENRELQYWSYGEGVYLLGVYLLVWTCYYLSAAVRKYEDALFDSSVAFCLDFCCLLDVGCVLRVTMGFWILEKWWKVPQTSFSYSPNFESGKYENAISVLTSNSLTWKPSDPKSRIFHCPL